jgi:hypothetical protein
MQSHQLTSFPQADFVSEQDTQRVKDLRFAYRLWSFTIDPRNFVFIDETGIHLGMTRLYGRAPIGERLYDSESPGDPGKHISLIGGMSIDGLIATKLFYSFRICKDDGHVMCPQIL